MVTTVQAVAIGIGAFFLGGMVGVVVMAIAGASKDDFGRDRMESGGEFGNADFSGLPRPTSLPPLGPGPHYTVGMDLALGKPCDVPAVLSGEIAKAMQRTPPTPKGQLPLLSPAPGSPPRRPKLLTATQAARRLGMSRRWLYDHWRELPFVVRIGPRCLRFDPDGLKAWAAHRKSGGAA